MTAREPRFEVVHNPGERQPWWARYVAANGRIVWTTESYHRRGRAIEAIEAIEAITGHVAYGTPAGLRITRNLRSLEVREVDE